MFPRAQTLERSQLSFSICRVTNVRLLSDVGVVGAQQLDEIRNGTGIDNGLGVFRSTRGDVWMPRQ